MMGTTSSGVQRDQFTAEQTKIISSLAFYLRITGMIALVNVAFAFQRRYFRAELQPVPASMVNAAAATCPPAQQVQK